MNNIKINNIKFLNFLILLLFFKSFICAQNATQLKDTLKNETINFHFQQTEITQYHSPFKAKYTGYNSLDPSSETQSSISSTLFIGAKIFKNFNVYFDPEISGGGGFSQTTGIAGFSNGEVYRVSDPSPHIYVARFYFNKIFPLDKNLKNFEDGVNQVKCSMPESYISIRFGKLSVMDCFDNNKYSHDPRSQFFNWALMGNGAWDYPANTRGYTYGLMSELIKPLFAARFGMVMVPTTPNGHIMDFNIGRSHSFALEFEKKYKILNKDGAIRLTTFLTEARMGNYQKSIELGLINNISPNIDLTGELGRTKYGAGINLEQNIFKNAGLFFRCGWNDGHNETWAFTEIDRHLSVGFSVATSKKDNDICRFGLELIVNGISKDHCEYLKAGGFGFIIGDGNLNYSNEIIIETYNNFKFFKYPLYISPDYQFVVNPAYNKDRGSVNIFGIRVHYEM